LETTDEILTSSQLTVSTARSSELGIDIGTRDALFTVCLQFTDLVVWQTLHYTRVTPVHGNRRYLTSTAIFLTEVIKLFISLTFTLHDISKTHPSSSSLEKSKLLLNSVFSGDSWKLTIPAVAYTLQSSLLYTAISNLSVSTFQINYQLKILTTALFSVSILRKQLSATRWVSLVLLAAGIAIVQIPEPRELLNLIRLGWAPKLVERDAAWKTISTSTEGRNMNASKGFAAVVAAAIISGLTGVYFEKVVKDSAASVSIWTRNVQLSFYSLFPALFFGVLYRDGAAIREDGFFVGYSGLVWVTILLQVLGGITVAICVAQMDNIIKNFAVSISIVFSFLIEVFFFGSKINANVSCT
jgi:UDP-sugar transporter A1/2/3